VKWPRTAGILLHPTSLPGPHGIGDLGPEAHRFVDFLASARQGLWQVLPLGPTGYGDSPYQCFSVFAGNPLLVSLEKLVEDGYLSSSDLGTAPAFPAGEVDFEAVRRFRVPLLAQAFERFSARASPAASRAFRSFCRAQRAWLEDYALFAALKDEHGGRPWHQWDRALSGRRPAALRDARRRLARQVEREKLVQFLFFSQWAALRRYGRERRLRLMGDLPIFAAHDSADVWAHPGLFQLRDDGTPAYVAGVPPDYFSATGQRWGNPLYRWDAMRRRGYGWWIDRFRATFALVDVVRVDHFRGLEAYWQIPAAEPNAIKGRWVKGPGAALFRVLERALGELQVVAENLGVITPEVEGIRERFGFPGMAILQFAFGTDPQGPSFRPHNYGQGTVAYTGTHDNDTTLGWWTSDGIGNSTRTEGEVREERDHCLRYLGRTDGREINWAFIRAVVASVADTAVVPLQDVLGLGSEARMNVPARPAGNWRWRFRKEQLTPEIEGRLRDLSLLYDRAPAALRLSPRRG
jgi:4-alpha-glucanotransferase